MGEEACHAQYNLTDDMLVQCGHPRARNVAELLLHERAHLAANVSVVHDVPEPGEARRRHVRAFPARYPFTACAARPRARAAAA
jgi:hypothetical protein